MVMDLSFQIQELSIWKTANEEKLRAVLSVMQSNVVYFRVQNLLKV